MSTSTYASRLRPSREGRRRTSRTRAITARLAALALATTSVSIALPAGQAAAASCGTWTSLGNPTNLTVAGEYAGQAVLEWNNCPGIANYKIRGRYQWSYYFDTHPPAGMTGIFTTVTLDTLDQNGNPFFYSTQWMVGNTNGPNICVATNDDPGDCSGMSGNAWPDYYNRWQVTIEITTKWSDGSTRSCNNNPKPWGDTTGHDFNNGLSDSTSRDLVCPIG